jgi:hypothetical protein
MTSSGMAIRALPNPRAARTRVEIKTTAATRLNDRTSFIIWDL